MSNHARTGSDVAPSSQPPSTPGDGNPPTYAAFSPSTLSQPTPHSKVRSAILVHQKSPLLAATPPQITRVLAYSHPFLLPLNQFVGLVTWTTGDPWESFLLVAGFWAVVLYGDAVTRYAGPVIVVVGLILGMYSRRYSPLSSTGWTGEKGQKVSQGHKRAESESSIKHHKSLEEIVDTLKLFTSRCNILLDPFLRLTDFLSTQRTATSATTRPALTVLFIRILFVLPLWIVLTLPPLYVLSTKRVVLAVGTVMLSWHSRPARVSRTILWRSRMVRRICTILTGLDFGEPAPREGGAPNLPPRRKSAQEIAASLAAKRRPDSPGVRFTFSIYENQRRWLGIGWTASMLAYERASWTDEHLNPTPSKDGFELPEVEGGQARWRWVAGSEWRVEGADTGKGDKGAAANNSDGWIYYDNKWRDGRRGQDGWGRYTRRRKWYRDAELVEVTPSTEVTPIPTPRLDPVADAAEPAAASTTPGAGPPSASPLSKAGAAAAAASTPAANGNAGSSTLSSTARPGNPRQSSEYAASSTSMSTSVDNTDAASTRSRSSRRSWFHRGHSRSRSRQRSDNNNAPNPSDDHHGNGIDGAEYGGGAKEKAVTIASSTSTGNSSRRSDEDDVHTPLERTAREDEWRLGDDIRMQLDI